jgi:SpoIID/LytB domain protein
MSQWGAKAMAEKGFDVAAILTFYYQGAELTRLAH